MLLLGRVGEVKAVVDKELLGQGQVVVETVLLDGVGWKDLRGHQTCVALDFVREVI